MKLFGFTFIRTKELDVLKIGVKHLNWELDFRKKLFDAILDADKKRREQEDIELRKWSVEVGLNHPYYIFRNAENTYRYAKTGDTSIFEDYKEFLDWRKKKEDAKASESHSEAQ